MGRRSLIFLAMILHLYCVVNSMDSKDSMSRTPNNTTPMILQNNVSNSGKTDDAVHLSEMDLSEVMKKCNASYQIPISNEVNKKFFFLINPVRKMILFLDYMEEMNMTGSYPDETEKLPMVSCYC